MHLRQEGILVGPDNEPAGKPRRRLAFDHPKPSQVVGETQSRTSLRIRNSAKWKDSRSEPVPVDENPVKKTSNARNRYARAKVKNSSSTDEESSEAKTSGSKYGQEKEFRVFIWYTLSIAMI